MSDTISQAPEGRASIFQSDLPLEMKLEQARTELLDLSARNRLLSIPRSAKSSKTLEIVDELSAEIYRLLVGEQKAFTFLPGTPAPGATESDDDGEGEIALLAQPEDDNRDGRGVAFRHADTRLQTKLTAAGLQKRLLDLYYDARTLEEEQGVNILFLALGTLRWADPNNPANVRYAPLVLIPVSLERGNAAEKFKLRWRQEDPAANLSLEAYLERIHGMKLPLFEAGEDFDVSAYMSAVAEAVEGKANWAVNPDDMVLGFFSFAKFLMYRDLDLQTWPVAAKLSEHPIVRSLLTEGFPSEELLLDEEEPIDDHISPAEMVHIVDSDSSQTLAVHEVRVGANLVIQGPPGTGKSQTIANIIASAVADGRTVLFVAEKMAALEVVKRRLDNTGVGDACLELHSNKANKRAVLENLRRTWELGAPRGEDLTNLAARLTEARDQLNAHAERLHRQMGAAEYSPYEVVGHLTRLKQDGQGPTDVTLEGAVEWTAEDFRHRRELLSELAERVVDIGVPAKHLWRGVDLAMVLPTDVDRLEARLTDLVRRLEALVAQFTESAGLLQSNAAETLSALDDLAAFAVRVAGAPEFEPEALGSPRWKTDGEEILHLLDTGERHAALRVGLAARFTEAAWSAELDEIREVLRDLPPELPTQTLAQAKTLCANIAALTDSGRRLTLALGRDQEPGTYSEFRKLITVGERVANAPVADAAAFAADLWDSGVERAADLAAAVAALEAARAEIGTALSDLAWSADLVSARRVLASHGGSMFRVFNGEWRNANRLVQSYLAEPKAPLQRRLMLLDALARGQSALRLIQAEDGFGRSAFGSDWRGERSASAPLQALVEWMRSLRGLGAEPRLIASREPNRGLLEALAQEVLQRSDAVAGDFSALWSGVGSAAYAPFSAASAWEQCELDKITPVLERLWRTDATYRELAMEDAPTVESRRAEMELLAEGQEAAARLEAGEQLGRDVFGQAWRGTGCDWPRLRGAAGWIGENLDIHQIAAQAPHRVQIAADLRAALSERDGLGSDLHRLLSDLRAQEDAAIQPGRATETPVAALLDSLRGWRDHAEQLSKWAAYQVRAKQGVELGVSDIVVRLHSGALTPEGALPSFEMTYFETVLASQVREAPELLQFDGDLHDRTVRSFVDLDRQRIRHAALEVVRAHHRTIPSPTGGAAGPLRVLKGEIARKRGHMPIRQLVQKAGPAIQALKPVFMMSPLSVAQFLAPGSLTFDLLVMDEASQIQPVDALGAIARCRQVVVVGDPQQLPPTAFFTKMTGGADSEDENGATVADIESILGLFTARGLPLRMLRWHYRSRHESLIAISNREFYENKLIIVPSPFTQQSGLGLRFHHIRDGVFESGTTRTNPIEATVVAKAIIEHAIRSPKQSLGVVAFSAAQRRAILDKLELLRRQLPPEHEAFFQSHPAEPFFVKNLENVQGDERDVILISVGYGPTAPGAKPAMRFGPLGLDGGERRLNVLISRAKRRCEMFSSMTDEDIDPDFASARKGVFALKLFMHFARTGRMSLAEGAGQDRQDIFEAQVAQALHALGYQVHRKVGVSGLFVDIAVTDPDRPDRYLIGVECDGPAYSAARSARDRDRLRRAVLEDHGWIIHRIWSTDWFKRPREQLERLVAAVEAAKAELGARSEPAPALDFSYEIQAIEREDGAGMPGVAEEGFATAQTPYAEVTLVKPEHLVCELHEAPTGILTAMAEQVVLREGPIHFDEIVTRIRDAWGMKRAGGRIQQAVSLALNVAAAQQRVAQDGLFFSIPGAAPVVRDRSAARSPGLRKPEALPPGEIAAALTGVVGRNYGATSEQAILAVSRAFGFKATSAQLRDVIDDVLDDLIAKEVLARREALIELGPNAPARSAEEQAVSPVERLIAEGEHERLEFKQTLRWDVRQQAVNKKLEDVVVKTIAAFANHKGGTLLIGVRDDGGVEGLEPDLQCTGGNRDKFELHLSNLLNSRFSPTFRVTKVTASFPAVGDKLVCRVDVQRSRAPIWVTLPDQSGAVAERLFVRSGNASQEIPPSQIVAFVRENFDQA